VVCSKVIPVVCADLSVNYLHDFMAHFRELLQQQPTASPHLSTVHKECFGWGRAVEQFLTRMRW
jgi:hypothetical protein